MKNRDTVFINIVVEDVLSEVLLKKIIENISQNLIVNHTFCKGGIGYIKRNIEGFNNGAKINPFIILVDLDKTECPPLLLEKWITFKINKGFIFRIVVREIESWIMADRDAFANYISISPNKIPRDIEQIEDPKEFLLNLIKVSGNREIKNDMLPPKGSTSKFGPLYNDLLRNFIINHWNLERARKHTTSLDKLVIRLRELGNSAP